MLALNVIQAAHCEHAARAAALDGETGPDATEPHEASEPRDHPLSAKGPVEVPDATRSDGHVRTGGCPENLSNRGPRATPKESSDDKHLVHIPDSLMYLNPRYIDVAFARRPSSENARPISLFSSTDDASSTCRHTASGAAIADHSHAFGWPSVGETVAEP